MVLFIHRTKGILSLSWPMESKINKIPLRTWPTGQRKKQEVGWRERTRLTWGWTEGKGSGEGNMRVKQQKNVNEDQHSQERKQEIRRTFTSF